MSNQLAYLCNNYRTEVDPRSLVFASTAEARNDQAYLSSASFEEDNLLDPNTIIDTVNTYGKGALLREIDSRREAFIRFLKSLNTVISSALPQNYIGCTIETRSQEESIIFHLYCLIACKLFFKESSFGRLGSFVANVATRIYRIPQSARIMRCINQSERFIEFVPNTASDSNAYATLLSCLETSLSLT